MITTKDYVLRPNYLLPHLKRQTWRAYFFINAALMLVFVLFWLSGDTPPLCTSVLAASIFLGAMAVPYWTQRVLRNYGRAGWFSMSRRNEIDEDTFTTLFGDGTAVKNQLAGLFSKMERHPGYYLLWTTGKSGDKGIVPLPFEAFETPADRERFEALLTAKGVKISSPAV